MAKYIEQEAALYAVCSHMCDANRALEAIMNIPAADVAPVVRCRECIHRDGTPGQPNILCLQMKDDDFCSYGERRSKQ